MNNMDTDIYEKLEIKKIKAENYCIDKNGRLLYDLVIEYCVTPKETPKFIDVNIVFLKNKNEEGC